MHISVLPNLSKPTVRDDIVLKYGIHKAISVTCCLLRAHESYFYHSMLKTFYWASVHSCLVIFIALQLIYAHSQRQIKSVCS